MKLLALILLTLSSCSYQWRSLKPTNLTPEETAALQEAVDAWNACPSPPNLYIDDNGDVPITRVDHFDDPRQAGNTAEFINSLGVKYAITFENVEPYPTRVTLAHEIGHILLGPEHSQDPDEMMYEYPRADRHVSPVDCARLR